MADEDLASKNCVWVPDKGEIFVRGSVTDYLANGVVRVTIKNGVQEEIREVEVDSVERCNPAKFNKCEDMAELTHLNEPSVIYNLFLRYNDDLIYTYSGLFLVAINPYKKLPIYEDSVLRKLHESSRDEKLPPHIFAIAESSHRNLVANRKDQSILVTGESGAGKTENTKKIIQYLSSISNVSESVSSSEEMDDIHEKILRASPILESFGNAKTIKNNNSSRFGKFIKIYFDSKGLISGGTIDYYLLEKSRVSHQSQAERNYHVFYQMLSGEAKDVLMSKYSLRDEYSFYKYLSSSTGKIPQVDDAKDFRHLNESFRVMGFSESETENIFAGLAIILHLGNIDFISWKSDQASFTDDANISIVATLLGVDEGEIRTNFLKPKVKAGREVVQKMQRASEVKSSIDAFAKHLYEKLFQFIIARIDASLMPWDVSMDHFIGVLDIAGFEIFDINSFEQLCINYTNEKLQQFFNHHSFILEQSEYLREDIQWEYIDFGLDLQPTIDLIEMKHPMGILEILNEQCVLPKASEDTFMNKLFETWDNSETKQFRPNKVRSGFIIEHYAGFVEYNIEDWLEKNKDPVSESVLSLMQNSTNLFVKKLFATTPDATSSVKSRGKSPKFKTVTQKHKEQLSNLMLQLESTEPHFVRCILPNSSKKSNKFDKELVLHQLRCNGVLEGIRIARAGYPNKMTFEDFFGRYFILSRDEIFTKNLKTNCELILKHIALKAESFKIGITKLFFKNGILGSLEELRDASIKGHLLKFQSMARGQIARVKIKKQIAIIQASQVVARNFQKLDDLINNSKSPWLKLFVTLKPLLEDSVKVLDSREMNESLKQARGKLKDTELAREMLVTENTSLKERLCVLEDDILLAKKSTGEKMEKLKVLEREEKSRELKLDESLRQLSEIQAVSASLAKDKAELTAKIEESGKSISHLKEQLESTEENRKTCLESIESLESKLKEHADIHHEHNKAVSVIKTLEAKCKDYAAIDQTLRGKERELEITRATIETNEQKLNESKEHFRLFEIKNEKLAKENVDLRTSLESKIRELESENLKLQNRVETLVREKTSVEKSLDVQKSRDDDLNKLKDKLKCVSVSLSTTEKKLQKESEDLEIAIKAKGNLEKELELATKHLSESERMKTKLVEEKQENIKTLRVLQSAKDSLNLQVKEQEKCLTDYNAMKSEIEFLGRTKSDHLNQISSLQDRIRSLEHKLENEEKAASSQSQMDPSTVAEYLIIKKKLNEQSAIIRHEKFENQKLSEEVRLLRKKVSDSFESPSKRSEARRSLALGDESRLSQMNDSRLAEEVKDLRNRVRQEESNCLRAENYAIDLQKKLNKLQATRGINTFTDYEAKFRNSQRRVDELEEKILSIISDSSNCSPDLVRQVMSRSNSLSSLNPQNSVDFARIYNDINHTLKATRDELGKSKMEILRLKSLLRESEDELYETKKGNLMTSVRDYEESMAKLKLDNNNINRKHNEIQQLLDKYMKRSEEYFEKLELAESAVTISKRHESLARAESEERKAELKLIKEELRTSEKLVRQLRQDNNEVEMKLSDTLSSKERMQDQMRIMQEKISYLDDVYGGRKNTIEQQREEIKSLRDDVTFKLEKETEIIKDNKRLKIENDELLKIKEEVLAENKEVADENESVVVANAALQKIVTSLQNETSAYERKIDQANKQIVSLREIIDENGRQLETLNAINSSLQAEKSKLENEVSILTDQLNSANENAKILQGHIQNVEDEKRQSKLELEDLRGRWDSSDGSFKKARTENLVIVEENESLKAINLELKRKTQDLETKLYSNDQLRYLESNLGKLNEEIDHLKSEISAGEHREEAFRKTISTLEYDQESKSLQLKRYNDENFNYQNMVSQYKGRVEFLFQENSEKDLRIKAQERELAQLRERILIAEREGRNHV